MAGIEWRAESKRRISKARCWNPNDCNSVTKLLQSLKNGPKKLEREQETLETKGNNTSKITKKKVEVCEEQGLNKYREEYLR